LIATLGRVPDGMKLDFQRVKTRWNQDFMTFR